MEMDAPREISQGESVQEKCSGGLEHTFIKVSMSDIEMDKSDEDGHDAVSDLFDPDMEFKSEDDKDSAGECPKSRKAPSKDEIFDDSIDYSDSDEDYYEKKKTPARKPRSRTSKKVGSSKKKERDTVEKKKAGSRKRKVGEGKVRKKRGRPKQPRRLDGTNDTTSGEESDTAVLLEYGEEGAPFRLGCGYNIGFKVKVLKYLETHSTTATSEKFGVNPKRVREWKAAKEKIMLESKGKLTRRPRTDLYTLGEKLQAVMFAEERSMDEARLLYNVDKRTLSKWKKRAADLQAGVDKGHGDNMRNTGCGRKPQYTHIEESLRDWIIALRLKQVTVNHRMILAKAKQLMIEQDLTGKQLEKSKPPTTRTWVMGFLKRQGLTNLLGTTLGHEDPREILKVDLKSSDGIIRNLAEQVEIPENPNKRLRRSISLQDKFNIIKRIENGETQMTVSKDLHIATSTVQTIWSCRKETLQKYYNPKLKPKTSSLLWRSYAAISSALFDWYEQNNTSFTRNTLMEKALGLSATYKMPGFQTDAKEWLKIFCKKYKLEDKLVEDSPNQPSDKSPLQYSPPNPESANQSVEPYDTSHNECNLVDLHRNDSVTTCNVPTDDHAQTPYNSSSKLESDIPTHIYHSSTISTHSAHPANSPPETSSLQWSYTSTTPGHQSHTSYTTCSSLKSESVTGTSTNVEPTITAISSLDALKHLQSLRTWTAANYGSGEETLNYHLSALETVILRKRAEELGATNLQ